MNLLEKLIILEVTEVKSKILSITGLATTSAFNAVETKIPGVSNLVKKTSYDATISGIQAKYFTTSNYNKFTGEIFDTKITRGVI